MLEKQLSAILAHHLREFIENVNEEQLRISLWSGEVVLHNLTLRHDVLDQVIKLIITNSEIEGGSESAAAAAKALLLPFTVVNGIVETLRISVPWTVLQGEPVSMELEGIQLEFGPLRGRPYQSEEEDNRSGVIQQKQLQQYERFREAKGLTLSSSNLGSSTSNTSTTATTSGTGSVSNGAGSGNAVGASEGSGSSALITTIARNAHIVLRRISCKYLHDYRGLHPSLASMLEVYIAEVFVATTDEEWEARFVSDPNISICKQITVEGFQVRVYSDKKENIGSKDDILSSTCWGSEVVVARISDTTIRIRAPSPVASSSSSVLARTTDVFLQMSPLEISITFDAALHMSLIGQSLAARNVECSFFRRFLYMLDEPDVTIARRRWRFALAAVQYHNSKRKAITQNNSHTKNTLQETMSFCALRRDYISLFKRHLGVRWLPPLDESGERRLTTLEKQMRVDQIVFLRCIANAEISCERTFDEQQRTFIERVKEEKLSSSNAQSRWTSWFRYGSKATTTPQAEQSGSVQTAGLVEDPVSVKATGALFHELFEQEWTAGLEYLSSGAGRSRLADVPRGQHHARTSSHHATSVPTLEDEERPVRIHVDLSSVTTRIIPNPVKGSLASDILSVLKQACVLEFTDIAAEVTLNSSTIHHSVSLDVGACEGFFATLPSRNTNEREDDTSSTIIPELAFLSSSGSIISPVSPSGRSAWLSVGVTRFGDVDVRLQKTFAFVNMFQEGSWWTASIGDVIQRIYRTLDAAPSTDALVRSSDNQKSTPPSPSVRLLSADSTQRRTGKFTFGVTQCIVSVVCDAPLGVRCTVPSLMVEVDGGSTSVLLQEGLSIVSVDGDEFERVVLCPQLRITVEPESAVHGCTTTTVDLRGEIAVRVGHSIVRTWGDAARGVAHLQRLARLDVDECDTARVVMLEDVFAVSDGRVSSLELSSHHQGNFTEGSKLSIIFDGGQKHSLSRVIVDSREMRDVLYLLWLRRTPSTVPPAATAPQSIALANSKSRMLVRCEAIHVHFLLEDKKDFDVHCEVRSSEGNELFQVSMEQSTSLDGSSLSMVELMPFSMKLTSENKIGDDDRAIRDLVAMPCVAVQLRQEVSQLHLATTSLSIQCRDSVDVAVTSCLVDVLELLLGMSSTLSVPIIRSIPKQEEEDALPRYQYRLSVDIVFEDVFRQEIFISETDKETGAIVAEKNFFVLELEQLKVALRDDGCTEQLVDVTCEVGCAHRVEWNNGTLLPIFGTSTSRRNYAPQTCSLHLVTPYKVVENPDGTFTPALSMQMTLNHGKVCHHHGFMMLLASIYLDPILLKLSSIGSSKVSRIGFSELIPSTINGFSSPWINCGDPAPLQYSDPHAYWTHVDVTVNGIEILLASEADEAISEEDAESFFYMYCENVSVTLKQQLHADHMPFLRTHVKIGRVLSLQQERSDIPELYEMIHGLNIQISSNLLCLYEQATNGYRYQYTDSLADTTTQGIIVQGSQQSPDNSNVCGIEVALTVSQWKLLARCLFRNVMVPLTISCGINTKASQVTSTPAILPYQILMFTVPSFRLVLTTSDHRTFSIRGPEGIRLYQVSGGSAAVPETAIDFGGFVVEETSSLRTVVDMNIFRSKQMPRFAQTLHGQQLVRVDRTSVRTGFTTEGEGGSYYSTKVDVQSVSVYPFVASLFAVRDALLDDDIAMYAASVPDTAAEATSPPKYPSRLCLSLHSMQVHLFEPWGEQLGDICVGGYRMDIFSAVDGAQELKLLIDDFSIRHVMSDIPGLDTPMSSRYDNMVSVRRFSHEGEESSHERSAAIEICIITPSSAILGSVPKYHVSSTYTEEPCSIALSDISIIVRRMQCVLLPMPLLRIMTYASSELLTLSSISYGPKARAESATEPRFDGMKLHVVCEDTRVVVPCVGKGKHSESSLRSSHTTQRVTSSSPTRQATLHDEWVVAVGRVSITNSKQFDQEAVHTTKRHPHSHLMCMVETYRIHVESATMRHAQLDFLPPLLHIEDIVIQAVMPLPLTTMGVSKRSLHVARSDSVVTTHHCTILPFQEVHMAAGVVYKCSNGIEISSMDVRVTHSSLDALMRCLPVVTCMPPAIPYYHVEDFKYDSSLNLRVRSAVCKLVDELSLNATEDYMAHSAASEAQRKNGDAHGSMDNRHTLVTLHVQDLWLNQESDISTLAKVEVQGAITVSDGFDNVVVFRDSSNEATGKSTICVTLAQPVGAGLTVDIATHHVGLAIQSFTVDMIVSLERFVSKISLGEDAAPQTREGTTSTASSAPPPVIKVTLHDSTIAITDVAIAKAKCVSLVLGGGGSISTPIGSTVADVTVAHPATHQNVLLEGFALSRAYRGSLPQRSFVEVASADVRIAPGELQVRVVRSRISNYSSSFFVEVMTTVQQLQDYFFINARLPKQQEEGYRQAVLLSFSDFGVSLHSGDHDDSTGVQLTLSFPGFVIRQVSTQTSSEVSVDTEDGLVNYHDSTARTLLTIGRGLSFSLHMTSNERNRSSTTQIKLGPISVVVPIGTVLQNFVEVVSAAAAPVAHSDLFAPAESDGLGVVAKQQIPTQTSSSFSLVAPMLSLHVCASSNDNQQQQGRVPTSTFQAQSLATKVLFGVNIHDTYVASSTTPDSESLTVRIMEINSVVDSSIQRRFVAAMPLVVEGEVTPAVLLVREYSAFNAQLGVHESNPPSAEESAARTTSSHSGAKKTRHSNLVVKICDFDITISPSLLYMINDNILTHVAIATKRANEAFIVEHIKFQASANATVETPSRRPGTISASQKSSASSSTNHHRMTLERSATKRAKNTDNKFLHRVLVISDLDYILKADLVVGGASGVFLHFVKPTAAVSHPNRDSSSSAAVSTMNTIRFRAPVGSIATVYLSPLIGADGCQYLPISVDEGLSVYCESVRFVLTDLDPQRIPTRPSFASDMKLIGEFVNLSPRSVFRVEAGMVAYPSTGGVAAAAAQQGAAVSRQLFHSDNMAQSRTTHYTVRADILAKFAVRLCTTFHQSLSLSSEVSVTYQQESTRKESKNEPRIILDERGEIAVTNVNLVSDSGNITTSPTGLIVNVAYQKPAPEDDLKGGPRTCIKAIIPAATFVISIGHVKLMHDIMCAIQQGTQHIGSIELPTAASLAAVSHRDYDEEMVSNATTSAIGGADHYHHHVRSSHTGTAQLRNDSMSFSSSSSRPLAIKRLEGLIPQRHAISFLDVGLTAPELSISLTNDFFNPICALHITHVAVQGNVARDVRSMKLSAYCDVSLEDYPVYSSDGWWSSSSSPRPRQLLQCGPEVVVSYDLFDSGSTQSQGSSLQVAVAVSELVVNTPVATLLKLSGYAFAQQKTGAHSFLNTLGVPVVLISADGGMGTEVQSTTPLCELPSDIVVKADIFRYDQTVFRIALGTASSVEGKRQMSLGQEVDLRHLHTGATLGLTFVSAMHQMPIYDVLLRLDPKQRVVTLSSKVVIKNCLAKYDIQLFSSEERFPVSAGTSFPIPIPVLQYPMQLAVADTWFHLPNTTCASFIQWDSFLSAFLEICDTPTENASHKENASSWMDLHGATFVRDGVLAVPLKLYAANRKVATAADDDKGHAHSDVPLCVMLLLERRPTLNLKVLSDSLGGSNSGAPSKHASPQFEVVLSVHPVTRIWNSAGVALSLQVSTVHGITVPLELGVESSCDVFSPVTRNATNGGESATITLCSSAESTEDSQNALVSKGKVALPTSSSEDAWIVLQDASNKEMYLKIHRNEDGTFFIASAAALYNRIPLPIEVHGSAGSSQLLSGQGTSGSLLPQSAPLMIGFPRAKQDAVTLRIRVARRGARMSQGFPCSSISVSNVVSSDEAHLVHVFAIRREVLAETSGKSQDALSNAPMASLLKCPRIYVEPVWRLRNAHPKFTLRVRAVNLDDHVIVVPPLSTVPLVTFHVSTAADPAIQVLFSVEDRQTFEWSCPLPLASISKDSTACCLRHWVRPGEFVGVLHEDKGSSADAASTAPVYRCTKRESKGALTAMNFACLSVFAHRTGQGNVDLECNLVTPQTILENRTSQALTFQHNSGSVKGPLYHLDPHCDTGVAWEAYSAALPTLTLHLTDANKKSHHVVVDILSQSASKDPLCVGNGLYVLCMHDTARHVYFVSVASDRLLEANLLTQSQLMISVELFIRKGYMHVSTPFATKTMTSLDALPIASIARRGELSTLQGMSKLSAKGAHKVDDAFILQILSEAELDLFAITWENFYVNLCSNGVHQFGELSLESILVRDCSLPSPQFPTVVSIEGNGSRSSSTTHPKPGVHIKAHFGDSAVVQSTMFGQIVSSVCIRKLHVEMETIHVKLSDALLFTVRTAATHLSDCSQATDSISATDQQHPRESGGKLQTRLFVERLRIAPVRCRLSLSRRGDGRFNPFQGIPVGALIPSVEAAPIDIGEVLRADVLCVSSSAVSALTDLLIPIYRYQALMQTYRVIGSIQAIGNPIMLAADVTAGVKSFVRDTVDLHPLQGATSLLQLTTAGAFHSVALLSRVGGKATALMSGDSGTLESVEVGEGSRAGAQGGVLWGLASGVVSGLTGVVRDPIRGLQRNGAAGFVTGVVTGAVGVVSRPVTGVLEGIGNTAEALSLSLKTSSSLSHETVSGEVFSCWQEEEIRAICTRNYVSENSVDLPRAGSTSTVASTLTSPRQNETGSTLTMVDHRVGLTRMEFLNAAINSLETATSEQERWRNLIQVFGSHNIARHAPWNEYLKYTTPTECLNTIGLVVENIVAQHLLDLKEHGAEDYKAMHRSKKAMLEEETLLRAVALKNSLGAREAIKFRVPLEALISVSCVAEIRLWVAPEELQRRIAPLIKEHVDECLKSLLTNSWS